MLATSASRPAIFSETMRRVRLEKESANRNCPARCSQPGGGGQCSARGPSSVPVGGGAPSTFRLGSRSIRLSRSEGPDSRVCKSGPRPPIRTPDTTKDQPSETKGSQDILLSNAVRRLDAPTRTYGVRYGTSKIERRHRLLFGCGRNTVAPPRLQGQASLKR